MWNWQIFIIILYDKFSIQPLVYMQYDSPKYMFWLKVYLDTLSSVTLGAGSLAFVRLDIWHFILSQDLHRFNDKLGPALGVCPGDVLYKISNQNLQLVE